MKIVMRCMLEKGLMTEEFGSVPLFRYAEKMRLSVEPIEHNLSNLSNTPKIDIPDVTEEEKEVIDNGFDKVEKPPVKVDTPVGPALENRVSLQEAELKSRARARKLIADLMLEGWNNEKIYNHINDNKLDERFSHPVSMENIYQVRTRFKQKGITDQMQERQEIQERQVVTPEKDLRETPENDESPRVLFDFPLQGEVVDPNGKIIGEFPPRARKLIAELVLEGWGTGRSGTILEVTT